MDVIARMERMIADERNPRKREEMRQVLANTVATMEKPDSITKKAKMEGIG